MYSPQRANNFFFRYGCPATMALIAVNIVSFFTAAIMQAKDPFQWLIFFGGNWLQRPWTLVTWPLYGGGPPFNVLFACLWAFWVCGSLERSWGIRNFLAFFFGTAALTALTTWLGARLLTIPVEAVLLVGLFKAIAAPTVAWCVINSREVVRLYGIIAIPAPLLGWLSVILLWYEVGAQIGLPLLGLFALSGCAFAFWYARYGRYAYQGYSSTRNSSSVRSNKAPGLRMEYYDEERGKRIKRSQSPLGWLRARQERRKLEQLWKRSISQDPPDEKRNS